jgi:hypothetical protein
MKRPARVPSQLSESLHQRLSAYTFAASAAGVSVLALSHPAEARIVYTSADVKFSFGSQVPIDLNHDGVVDFYIKLNGTFGPSSTRSWIQVYWPPDGSNATNAVRGKSYLLASALPAGVGVGTLGQDFLDQPYMAVYSLGAQGSRRYSGPWWNGGKGRKNMYLGLRFEINGKAHFGWARLNVTVRKGQGINHFSGLLTGYAYETIPNKPIIAGKEHGKDDATLGRLAQGASGR